MNGSAVLKGTRVFISGGAGVIGLEMIPRLVEAGATVFVGDLKPRPSRFPAGVHYRQGDLNFLTKAEMGSFSPEIFIHLAATFERSTETLGFWEENFWHNLRLSHHLMAIFKESDSLKRVVFASSYLVYDPAQYQFAASQDRAVELKESDAILPRNLIGMAKLAHELELRFLTGFLSPKCSIVCARIYRGYGRNSRDVISRWIKALLAGETIAVYRPEGQFDYIYAKDSAEGLLRLASSTVTGILNLGTGRARRVQDIVNVLRQHFPGLQATQQDSDIPCEASAADMSTFRAAIGWTPTYDLEQAIPEIIAHERSLRSQTRSAPDTGHVVITSASRKVPLIRAVQDAARRLGPDIAVIAGDSDESCLSRYVADGFWRMPRVDDGEVEALVRGCRERGVKSIFPTRDGELKFWARHQQRFSSEGIRVHVSPESSVEICLDKLNFARSGGERGLPFIPAARHPDELETAVFVVKERYGAGARRIGLALDREAAIAHGATLKDPIYQPFISGKEISVDAWMNCTGQVKGLVLRRRDYVMDGESQVTTTFRDDRTEAAVREILLALDLRGPAVLQVLLDAEGQPHVIECNSRFGGASTASIAAGLDVFYWSLLESSGVDLSDYPFDRVPGEIRQIRVPADIHIHGHRF
ncbi:MAG: NAD-dependent epimerase/dehydratase family protein [Dongiaceae bacterium]